MIDDLFILGSGFSKAVSSGIMPTLAELSNKIAPRLNEIFRSNELPPKKLGNNIEALLSYLAVDQAWLSKQQALRNRAAFLDLTEMIRDELDQSQNLFIVSNALKENIWYSSLVKKWDDNQNNIITFNYDLLIECAATKIPNVHQNDLMPVILTPVETRDGCGLLGGENHPSLQLYKLHGSSNWFYSGKSEFQGEVIYTIPVRDGIFTGKKEDIILATKDKVPLIVPPTLDKTSYFNNETIRIIWQAAGQAFKIAKRVFCLGYSFPETDMMIRHFILTNENPEGAKFYWINLSEHAGKLEDLLPENYTIDRTYLGTDSIKNFAEAYTQGKIS